MSCATNFLINQYQIIIFLILKSDNIENSRIELKEIVLPVPSNLIVSLLIYPSTWYICDFFLFDIEIEEKSGWIIWGGGGQRVCWTPLVIGSLAPLPPSPQFLRLWDNYYLLAHVGSLPFQVPLEQIKDDDPLTS